MDDDLFNEFGRIMDARGAYQALKEMKPKIGAEHDTLYKASSTWLLKFAAEARSEMKKLDAVLTRIEMQARKVQLGKSAETQLLAEVAPFGGWSVSLLETYISYCRFMRGNLADQKITEIAKALNELRLKQDTENIRFGKFADIWQDFAKH